VFPAGVHVASTWDPSLIYARGNAMGTEAKGVGVHVQLAPVAGALVSQPVSTESSPQAHTQYRAKSPMEAVIGKASPPTRT
jgi:hypothetical protein